MTEKIAGWKNKKKPIMGDHSKKKKEKGGGGKEPGGTGLDF